MKNDILSALRPALVMTALFALLTGLLYPLATLGVGQLVFPHQANGSLIVKDGKVAGSELIGQAFSDARYFHGRPSAAGTGYDAGASSGSNLGPTSQALSDRVTKDVAALHAEHSGDVPADLVTTSGSGLDPDISVEAARWQIARVANARKLPEATVSKLVDDAIEQPLFGVLGEAHINVLALNRALDAARSR